MCEDTKWLLDGIWYYLFLGTMIAFLSVLVCIQPWLIILFILMSIPTIKD